MSNFARTAPVHCTGDSPNFSIPPVTKHVIFSEKLRMSGTTVEYRQYIISPLLIYPGRIMVQQRAAPSTHNTTPIGRRINSHRQAFNNAPVTANPTQNKTANNARQIINVIIFSYPPYSHKYRQFLLRKRLIDSPGQAFYCIPSVSPSVQSACTSSFFGKVVGTCNENDLQ